VNLDLTAAETAGLAAKLKELHDCGYKDVTEHGALRIGTRIRGRSEQYHEALLHGTGIVIAITEKPDSAWSSSWGMPDVELIVLRDKARFEDWSRLSQLAQYHVAVV
jgi:hypothetical protein